MSTSTNTIISVLADPRRLGIVELLAAEGRLNATGIASRFEVTPAAISQHLKVLRQAEILTMDKRAQQRWYRLNPKAFAELEQWSQRMQKTWAARFNQLDALLQQDD